MNLRQMEVFRAVMLTGTIAGAADILHISQPATSKALGLAERQSGVQLFDRVKGRLVPTLAAKALHEEIEKLWTGVERVRKLSYELSHPSEGTLHIAASSSLGSAVVPAALASAFERFPKLKAKVDLMIPRMLVETLVDHTVDVGVALFAVDHPNLTTVARYTCGWVCVMPAGHPLCARKQIAPKDLRGYRLISMPSQPDYGIDVDELLGGKANRLDIGLEVRAGQSACFFSLAGAGVAIVDEATVGANVFPNLQVRPFLTASRLQMTVVRNAFKPLSPFAQAFCTALGEQWRGRHAAG